MRTLRAPPVAAPLAVVTVALLALAGITYAEQRSFPINRVGDQARVAVGAVRAMPEGDDRLPDRPRGGGPADHGGGLLLGTYGEHRDASGRVTSARFLGQDLLDASDLVAPRLPRDAGVGTFETVAGHGVGYRVHAQGAPDGDVTVVAVPAVRGRPEPAPPAGRRGLGRGRRAAAAGRRRLTIMSVATTT